MDAPANDNECVTRSCGNIFEDLDLPKAAFALAEFHRQGGKSLDRLKAELGLRPKGDTDNGR